MRLAKVDVIEEKELADEFDVVSFPTLKLFINGERKEPIEYTGEHTQIQSIISEVLCCNTFHNLRFLHHQCLCLLYLFTVEPSCASSFFSFYDDDEMIKLTRSHVCVVSIESHSVSVLL